MRFVMQRLKFGETRFVQTLGARFVRGLLLCDARVVMLWRDVCRLPVVMMLWRVLLMCEHNCRRGQERGK